jgi:hypothetical protein
MCVSRREISPENAQLYATLKSCLDGRQYGLDPSWVKERGNQMNFSLRLF